jgi:hypothetical protein
MKKKLNNIKHNLLEQWKKSFDYKGFSDLKLEEIKKLLLKQKNISLLTEKYGADILLDLEKLNISLIKSQAIAKKRGDLFEEFILSNSLKITASKDVEIYTQIDKKSILFPDFLKKDIPIDKIDLLIKSKDYNAVCYIQVSLWGGGQQLNRGEKYNSIEKNSLYDICRANGWKFHTIVCNEPPNISATKKETRTFQIIKSGHENNIMMYPSKFFHILKEIQ